ncbi:hypothetical protein [Pasteuria penetrans]|uniref:hypothetical protein n=1 Tax=Pasteuria penetrans TaxID=86005 RepID=UPI000F9F8DE7|nr:hypothetical protein [Pasteuria penetrans]
MKNKNDNKNFCRSLFHYRSRLLFSGIVVASLPFVSSGKLVGKEEESTEQKAPPQNIAEEAREDNSSENSASDEESAEQKQQSLQGSVDSIDNDKGKTLERKQEKFESKFIIREDIGSESAKEFLQFLKGGVTELDKVGASINAIEQNSLSQYIKKSLKESLLKQINFGKISYMLQRPWVPRMRQPKQ